MARQQARIRRTAAEWSRHVSAWRQSGLSAATYAKREGLKPKRLKWWSWKLRRDGVSVDLQLLPVQVVGEPAEQIDESRAASSEMCWELVTAAGDRLRGTEPLSAEVAHALVSALVRRS